MGKVCFSKKVTKEFNKNVSDVARALNIKPSDIKDIMN